MENGHEEPLFPFLQVFLQTLGTFLRGHDPTASLRCRRIAYTLIYLPKSIAVIEEPRNRQNLHDKSSLGHGEEQTATLEGRFSAANANSSRPTISVGYLQRIETTGKPSYRWSFAPISCNNHHCHFSGQFRPLVMSLAIATSTVDHISLGLLIWVIVSVSH